MGRNSHPVAKAGLLRWGLVAMVMGLMGTGPARAQTVVYNSIPSPLPVNVYASEGPNAYLFVELGEGLDLTATSGTLADVGVVLSSWACQRGNWSSTCTTTRSATFRQPITLNVYSVTDAYSAVYDATVPTPLALLGSVTQTFEIPYRPSSTPPSCEGGPQWYSTTDHACHNGISAEVTFDLSSHRVSIPSNGQIIVAVEFNTTSEGPHPIGNAPCVSSSGGCPYDSLNIGTYGDGPTGLANGVGSLLDTNGVFVDYSSDANACEGNSVTGTLALDAPCWTGYHPLIRVTATTGVRRFTKGDGP